jgi:hypothetical protein
VFGHSIGGQEIDISQILRARLYSFLSVH